MKFDPSWNSYNNCHVPWFIVSTFLSFVAGPRQPDGPGIQDAGRAFVRPKDCKSLHDKLEAYKKGQYKFGYETDIFRIPLYVYLISTKEM